MKPLLLSTLALCVTCTSLLAADAPKARRDKPKRPQTVGPVVGENKATPVERIKVMKDFKVELIYSVPGGDQGSWVNMCEDPQGRIIASDQYGGLYRFTPPAAGATLSAKDVQKLNLDIRAVNGMAFFKGALYCGVNDYDQQFQSGVYRITDSNGDGELDKVELLRAFESRGDHGVHAIVPAPDGKHLFLISGNGAKPTQWADTSPVPKVYGEDHLLPRMPDGRGFMRDVMGPGGTVYRFDPDGKNFEAYAIGFRNIFDGAFNRDCELFTYDADMEYDFNTSWYRPTRVCHVVSGGEFGWRNGAGKRPEWYPDNLPPVINIGPGSPTGTTFGYGAKFPAKYQNAFFINDWSWGKMWAVHMEPKGASYTATKEEFLSGSPLPLTDTIISQKDGAMYFAIGGRRVQSGVYRVTYVGKESVEDSKLASARKVAEMFGWTELFNKQRKEFDAMKESPFYPHGFCALGRPIREQFESFFNKMDDSNWDVCWKALADSDRSFRWTARTAIEHQPVASWAEKALSETDPAIQVEALMALARCAGLCPQHRTADTPPVDTAMRDMLLNALLKLDIWSNGILRQRDIPIVSGGVKAHYPQRTSAELQITALRTLEIILNRFDGCNDSQRQQLIAVLDPLYPAKTFEQNWLLTELLCYLQSPTAAAKGMTLIQSAPSQEEQIEYARSLRMLKAGWTSDLRKAQLEWFLKAANYKGGASFDKFIEFIRTDSLATFTEAEKTEHAALIAKKPEVKSAIENVGAMFVGRTPTNWTLDELATAAETGLKGRSFENGRKMFAAAACYTCHRFANGGGMTGPDLTQAGGRYSARDLLDNILNPSKVINEQFAPIVVTKNDGSQIIGVVVNLSGDTIQINTDLSNPNERKGIDRKEVKSIEPSKVSPMPPLLLSMLKKEEILDLVAYVLSGGDQDNAAFK